MINRKKHMSRKKAILLACGLFSAVLFAKEVVRYITDPSVDITNAADVNKYVKTVVNKDIARWKLGDTLTLHKDGKKTKWNYHSMMGSFIRDTLTPSGGSGSGGGSGSTGGNTGGGIGGGGSGGIGSTVGGCQPWDLDVRCG